MAQYHIGPAIKQFTIPIKRISGPQTIAQRQKHSLAQRKVKVTLADKA